MAETNSTVKKKTATKKTAANPADTQAQEQIDGGYSITTKKDGFRRVGRAWSGTTTVAPDELSKQQIDQLKADPMFVVVEL